jgi:hypothetical protein
MAYNIAKEVYLAGKKTNFVLAEVLRVLPLTTPLPLMARYLDGNDLERMEANGLRIFRWSINMVSLVLLD